MGVGPGAALNSTPRHPSQSAGSPGSAVGSNSAHPSPLPYSSNHDTAQPSRGFNVSSLSGGSNSVSGSGSAAAGAKRKQDGSSHEDATQKQQRSKRNRCKRRKIKCNGETPCQRCGNLSLSCLYAPNCCSNNFKDSDEFREMSDTVTRLQEQVETLFQNMNSLRQETLRLAPIQDRVLPLPTTASMTPSPSNTMSSMYKPDLPPFRTPLLFRGPTSASFTVDVAKNTLHNMGYSGAEGVEESSIAMEENAALSPARPQASVSELPKPRPQDPLWEFDRDEMIRLCRFHEEEVGIMYPVVNINDVIHHANFLANWMESAKKHGLAAPGMGQEEGVNDIKTLTLKIILCCALVVEEHGYSAKGLRLWESIQPIADKMLMSDPSDLTTLPFLALVGGYRFLTNDEVLAWRVMGQVARLCLEMGIHRREVIAKIEGEQKRKNAINTFWSAYILDRRWSFGTGFPFVVHDDKIDPQLPYPVDHPYLSSMITFSKLGAKIWKLVDYFDSVLIRDLKPEDFEGLDREILEWYDTVPEEIKIQGLDHQLPSPSTTTYNVERLQIWTRLRLNQIRIWLYTPVLHSASSIAKNYVLAQRAVDLSKETIRYLSLLNTHTDVYRRIQVFYHHFLTSAIAVLFLASTHAPLRFSAQCREEFHMALELIKDMSAKSWVSQRLWRTVKSLEAYAPRLGLLQDDDPRQRESVAMTMAGMARGGQTPLPPPPITTHRHSSVSSGGHQLTPSPGLTSGHGGQPPSSRMGSLTPHGGGHGGGRDSPHPDNGLRLTTEMSRMFEGFASGAEYELLKGRDTRLLGYS
ncbi:Protein STB5 [Cytospora mali]|uniref:Protein STB5 n=1 Tax=Cytospora mali TaxID=578113 RepID=A0A194UVB8_CYTMA|nr:Protein STB5 [Valsa mali var. pyri (nom. inval.)]